MMKTFLCYCAARLCYGITDKVKCKSYINFFQHYKILLCHDMKKPHHRLKLCFKCYHHIWKLKGLRVRLGSRTGNVLSLHWVRDPESFFQKVRSEVSTRVIFSHVLSDCLQWTLAWIRSKSWEWSSVNIIHLNTTANFLQLSEEMASNLLNCLF